MANARIHVGNLPDSIGDRELLALFAPFGAVRSARTMRDRDSGLPRGFGFVEMESPDAAARAIRELDGRECDGRRIRASEARERETPSREGPSRDGTPREAGARDAAGPRNFGPPRAPARPREKERESHQARKPIKGKGSDRRRDDDDDLEP